MSPSNDMSNNTAKRRIRITHLPSGEVLAEGRRGWEITPFEGNFYISSRALRTEGFQVSWIPGICPYKFLYLWMNFVSREGEREKFLGWKYVIPNPLFPFIWFRVGVPQRHPLLQVEEFDVAHERKDSERTSAT